MRKAIKDKRILEIYATLGKQMKNKSNYSVTLIFSNLAFADNIPIYHNILHARISLVKNE